MHTLLHWWETHNCVLSFYFTCVHKGDPVNPLNSWNNSHQTFMYGKQQRISWWDMHMSWNLPFHNGADIYATITPLVALTNDTDPQEIYCICKRKHMSENSTDKTISIFINEIASCIPCEEWDKQENFLCFLWNVGLMQDYFVLSEIWDWHTITCFLWKMGLRYCFLIFPMKHGAEMWLFSYVWC